jgi:hypothetical protein
MELTRISVFRKINPASDDFLKARDLVTEPPDWQHLVRPHWFEFRHYSDVLTLKRIVAVLPRECDACSLPSGTISRNRLLNSNADISGGVSIAEPWELWPYGL